MLCMRSMKVNNMGLSKTAINELTAIAATEQSNIEPVPGAEVGATTPGTDGHQQGAGTDGY